MNSSAPKQGPNTMSYSGPSAVNPMTTEPPYIPSSESTHSGSSYSRDHPGERVADSTVHTLGMQYVNHSNMTTTGYAYAEHGRSGLQGVTDVDVDEKPHLVYETMTEFQHQARQRMQIMNGANTKANVETGDGYAAVPNKAKRSDGTWCMLRLIWNVLLMIIVLAAFGLSVYNFIKTEANTVTTAASTTMPTTKPVQLTGEDESAQIAELNATVAELKEMLDDLSEKHRKRYLEVNNTILAAVESVRSVSPTNELDLTFGCVESSAECLIDHSAAGSPPSFVTCETSTIALSEDGMRNVNVYCNVDNAAGEANPLVATLNIYDSTITCICGIVAISQPSHSPACKLHVHRCPNTISLNTTM